MDGVYDIQRAIADDATKPNYYESAIEEITQGEELTNKEKLKSKWAALVGDPKCIALIAVNSGRALHAAFTEKGIKHIWSEDPGYGHDYQIWRIYLQTLLQRTFRD